MRTRKTAPFLFLAALLLVGPACGESENPPAKQDPNGNGKETDLGSRPTPGEDAVVETILAVHDAIVGESPSAEEIASLYEGELASWTKEAATSLGRDDHEVIASLLDGADTVDLEDVGGRLRTLLTLQLRAQLKEVSDKYPEPVDSTDDLLLLWDRSFALFQALVPLIEAADAYAGDDALPSLQAAFELANEGIHEGDAVKVGGARQIIEKTLFRGLHHGLLAEAEASHALANPTEAHFRAQRRALALLDALEDRMRGRNTKGLIDTRRMLQRPPVDVDVDAIRDALFINWAKRTYRYTFHALEDTSVLGTPGAVVSAIEGKTYYRLVAKDLAERIDDVDVEKTLGVWDDWAIAIRDSDLVAATQASEALEAQLCAYQNALGIDPCTGSDDEAATSSTLGSHLDPDSGTALALAKGTTFLDALEEKDVDAAKLAWGDGLEDWSAAKDLELGTDFAQQISDLLDDPAPTNLVEARWVLRKQILEVFKKESKSEVTDQIGGVVSKENQLLAWDACLAYFETAFQDIAKEADIHAVDDMEVEILRGFEMVNLGIHDGDPRLAGAGRQIVEKTMFRILFHQVLLHAESSQFWDSLEEAAESHGALLAFADRVETKVSEEVWDDLILQVDGSTSPKDIDVDFMRDLMLEAFAQRTFNYTKHAEALPESYGTPDAYAKAVEGHTYFQLIRPHLLETLEADGALWERMWQRWIAAIENGDTTRGKAASAFLSSETTGVCAYELALGMDECK